MVNIDLTGRVDILDEVYIIIFDRDGTDTEQTIEFIKQHGRAKEVSELPEETISLTSPEGEVMYPLALLVVAPIFARSSLSIWGMKLTDTGHEVPAADGGKGIKVYVPLD